MRPVTSLLVALLAVVPQAAACSACFGKSDAPLARGMNAGIFAMLVVVVGAWLSFGSFFVFIARRSRRLDREASGRDGAQTPS
jgi:hypothetical protein